jgi:uncharacterized protein
MKNILLSVLLFLMPFTGFAESSIHLILSNAVVEKTIEPNMVVLTIESWGRSATAKAAQELQKTEYAKIKSTVEKYKIKKEEFKTENFSVNPDYVYDQKTQSNKITGYRVSHQISIIYHKADDVGSLVDALASSGKATTSGVNVQNILWDYDKKEVIETSAINEAVRLARAKAEDLAKAAGVKIKAVHRVQHVSAFPTTSPYSMKAMALSAERVSSDKASTELTGGQIKVRVEVQMEFEI